MKQNCWIGSPVICSVNWSPCVRPDSSVDVPLPWMKNNKINIWFDNQKLEQNNFRAHRSHRGICETHLCALSNLVLGFHQSVNGSFTCLSINHHPPDLKTDIHDNSVSLHLNNVSVNSQKYQRHWWRWTKDSLAVQTERFYRPLKADGVMTRYSFLFLFCWHKKVKHLDGWTTFIYLFV